MRDDLSQCTAALRGLNVFSTSYFPMTFTWIDVKRETGKNILYVKYMSDFLFITTINSRNRDENNLLN